LRCATQGLDAVAHYYLRYANPDAFGDVSERERRQFGRVLDDYYAYVDSLVGDALSSLGENDLLIVVSGFGMEPLTFGKRLLERVIGDPRFTGTHERGPDGFLLAYGAAIAPARQARGAVVDVAPTLLYFLGLPVARDMDGFVRQTFSHARSTNNGPYVHSVLSGSIGSGGSRGFLDSCRTVAFPLSAKPDDSLVT
jgi:predicted AlkP superfamily phosphohydrolase/phosphomutase